MILYLDFKINTIKRGSGRYALSVVCVFTVRTQTSERENRVRPNRFAWPRVGGNLLGLGRKDRNPNQCKTVVVCGGTVSSRTTDTRSGYSVVESQTEKDERRLKVSDALAPLV